MPYASYSPASIPSHQTQLLDASRPTYNSFTLSKSYISSSDFHRSKQGKPPTPPNMQKRRDDVMSLWFSSNMDNTVRYLVLSLLRLCLPPFLSLLNSKETRILLSSETVRANASPKTQ